MTPTMPLLRTKRRSASTWQCSSASARVLGLCSGCGPGPSYSGKMAYGASRFEGLAEAKTMPETTAASPCSSMVGWGSAAAGVKCSAVACVGAGRNEGTHFGGGGSGLPALVGLGVGLAVRGGVGFECGPVGAEPPGHNGNIAPQGPETTDAAGEDPRGVRPGGEVRD